MDIPETLAGEIRIYLKETNTSPQELSNEVGGEWTLIRDILFGGYIPNDGQTEKIQQTMARNSQGCRALHKRRSSGELFRSKRRAVYREPCRMCGVRADFGCSHQPREEQLV